MNNFESIYPHITFVVLPGIQQGFKHSTAAKEKMKVAHSNKVISEETKEKMREARKGFKHSSPAVAKLKARVYTDKDRARISAALIGRKVSEETLNKLRAAFSLRVEVKDLETNPTQHYPSITLAAEALGASRSMVSRCIKNQKVFKGKYFIKLA